MMQHNFVIEKMKRHNQPDKVPTKAGSEKLSKTTDPKREMEDSSMSPTKRTSERRKNQKEFSMPTRADVWDKIADVPTTGMNALRPRKIVNDFVSVQSRYNYDAAYTSGEESPFAVSDDDSETYTKSKARQQKFAKKRNTESSSKKTRSKGLGSRQQHDGSSESLESSDDSVAKLKKQNKIKGTVKKLHMKTSSQKLLVESPVSSDSDNEAILRSCPKRPTVLDSSDSDVEKKSGKPLKMFSITKKKKNISVLERSSSSGSNNSEKQEKSRSGKAASFGEKDKRPKRGAIWKKTKPAHSKWESSDDNTKGSSLSVPKNSQDAKQSRGKKSSMSSEHSGSITDDKAHESVVYSESEADVSFSTLKKKNKSNIIEDEESNEEEIAQTEMSISTASTVAKD